MSIVAQIEDVGEASVLHTIDHLEIDTDDVSIEFGTMVLESGNVQPTISGVLPVSLYKHIEEGV